MAEFNNQATEAVQVRDSVATQVLANIYNYLSGKKDAIPKDYTDSIDDIIKHQQKSLAEESKRRSDTAKNNKAVQNALKGIQKQATKSAADERSNRAVQKALDGKMIKSLSNSERVSTKLLSTLKDVSNFLTGFVKDTLFESLRQQSDFARTLRKANLTTEQKQQAMMMANSLQGVLQKEFGLKAGRGEIQSVLQELLADGKDITQMSRQQVAAIVAARKSNIDMEKAYQLSYTASKKTIKDLSDASADIQRADIIAKTVNSMTSAEMKFNGGANKSLNEIVAFSATKKDSQMDTETAHRLYMNNMYARTGQLDKVDANLALMSNTINSTATTVLADAKRSAQSLSDTQLRIMNGIDAEFTNYAAQTQMADTAGTNKNFRIRTKDENQKSRDDNVLGGIGKVGYAIQKAFGELDNNLGMPFGKMAITLDEWFGDSIDISKVVSKGFSLVTFLLGKIVFNTTGGILGKILNVGKFVAAIALFLNRDKFLPLIQPVIDAVKDLLPPDFVNFISSAYNKVVGFIKPLIDSISKFFGGGEGSAGFMASIKSMAGGKDILSKDGMTNIATSILDGLRGMLEENSDKIKAFMDETVSPAIQNLMDHAGQLLSTLWDVVGKPLWENIKPFIMDNLPAILAIAAIKIFGPVDTIRGVFTGLRLVIRGITRFAPALMGGLKAAGAAIAGISAPVAAIAAAIAGLAIGIGAYCKWRSDRNAEKERAKQSAEVAAQANLKSFRSQQDYLAALEANGPNDEKTKELKKIWENTEDVAKEARKKAAKDQAIADLNDSEGKELVEGFDARVNALESARTAYDEMQALVEAGKLKESDEEFQTAKREWLIQQAAIGNMLNNAVNATNWKDNISDIRKLSNEDLLKAIGNTNQAGIGEEAVQALQVLQRNGVANGRALDVILQERKDAWLNPKSGRADREGYDKRYGSLYKMQDKISNSLKESNYSQDQLHAIAESLKIDVDPEADAQATIKAISNNTTFSEMAKATRSLDEQWASMQKYVEKSTDEQKKLIESINAELAKGIEIKDETINKLAESLGITDKNVLKDVKAGYGLTPMAKGAYVDKATPALIGEDGREVVLPLTKESAMHNILGQLSGNELRVLQKALFEICPPGRLAGYYSEAIDAILSRGIKDSFLRKAMYDSTRDIFYTTNGRQFKNFKSGILKLTRNSIDSLSPGDVSVLFDELYEDKFGNPDESPLSEIVDMLAGRSGYFGKILANNPAAFDRCNSAYIPVKDKDTQHSHLAEVDISAYKDLGVPHGDSTTVESILNQAKNEEDKKHAFWDVIMKGESERAKSYQTSQENLNNRVGANIIAGTPAEKALAAGAGELGKPYILEAMGHLGYVCNELTNYALSKSGADLAGFRVNSVAQTFKDIKSGKKNFPTFRVRDDLTPETALPGMLFFQDSAKNRKDGTFQPGHVGLVYYGHKRLHSTGGAAAGTYKPEDFMLGWQSNRGVVINDFDPNSSYKIGEITSLFTRADGTQVDTSAGAIAKAMPRILSDYDKMIEGADKVVSSAVVYNNPGVIARAKETELNSLKEKLADGIGAIRFGARGEDLYAVNKRLGEYKDIDKDTSLSKEMLATLIAMAQDIRRMAMESKKSNIKMVTKPSTQNFTGK